MRSETPAPSQLDFAEDVARHHPDLVVVAPITSRRVVKLMKWDDSMRTHLLVQEFVLHAGFGWVAGEEIRR